jgi:hypothetical protein
MNVRIINWKTVALVGDLFDLNQREPVRAIYRTQRRVWYD